MENAMERVLMVMNRENMNARTFCAHIGFGYSTFNNYVSEIRPANNFYLYKKVLNTFVDISAEWLIRGEGPMLKSEMEDHPNNSLLEIINKQQETIISQAKEIGKLEGRIEAFEKTPVKYETGGTSMSLVAENGKDKKYKKSNDE